VVAAPGRAPTLEPRTVVPAASCAFALPVATPPNAIVSGTGYVTIPQMVRAGIVLNVVGVVLIVATMWWHAPLVHG
jgi:solute carrier family 13 (sodium-dependent dicarboxylate transporter), member 2/3/5